MYKYLAKTLILGKKLHYLTSCHSTNDVALDMVRNNKAHEGDVVVTANQTAGRGQRGNSWEAQPGLNLTCSVILKPTYLRASGQFHLNMTVALGVLDYLRKMDSSFILKWPNDIFWNENKVGGILIQNTLKGAQLEWSVVGIGLNVNQDRFDHPKAISLKMIAGETFDLQHVLEGVMQGLEGHYLRSKNRTYDQMKEEYLPHLLGYGSQRRYKATEEFYATITDVTQAGKLELDDGREIRQFDIKEVTFL